MDPNAPESPPFDPLLYRPTAPQSCISLVFLAPGRPPLHYFFLHLPLLMMKYDFASNSRWGTGQCALRFQTQLMIPFDDRPRLGIDRYRPMLPNALRKNALRETSAAAFLSSLSSNPTKDEVHIFARYPLMTETGLMRRLEL